MLQTVSSHHREFLKTCLSNVITNNATSLQTIKRDTEGLLNLANRASYVLLK